MLHRHHEQLQLRIEAYILAAKVLGIGMLLAFIFTTVPNVYADEAPSATRRQATRALRIVKVSKAYVDFGSKVTVNYPRFVGGDPAVTEFLNAEIKKILDSNLIYDMEGGGSEHFKRPGSSFDGNYQLRLLSPHLVSISLQFFHCYQGAAHGESHYVYFNYELTPQPKALSLSDVLGPNADYKALSKRLYEKLRVGNDSVNDKVGLDSDLCDSGQTNFTFDKIGLVWNFGSYAIGSYAAGCPSATISYKELDSIVQPQCMGGYKRWRANRYF